MMASRGDIILLFIISAFLFVDSSAAGFPKIQTLPSSSTSSGNLAEKWWFKVLREVWPGDEIDYTSIFRNLSSSSNLRQGQAFPSASAMKRYLEYLGFLNKSLPDNSNGKFSTSLETDLKNFQRTYGLPVTGQPDDGTLSLLKSPRCGVPDATTMSQFRWPWPEEKKELTYAFLQEDKMTAPLKAVFYRAFARWEKVTGLSFNETTASFNESDIKIVFWRWKVAEVVAVSSLRGSSRVAYFDVEENWGPAAGGMDAGEVDLETAVMHQIGHMVGLGHTTIDQTAVMFPFMERGKRKLNFGANESERIQNFFNITSSRRVAAAGGGGGTSMSSSGGGSGTSGDGGGMGTPGLVLSLGIALLSFCF